MQQKHEEISVLMLPLSNVPAGQRVPETGSINHFISFLTIPERNHSMQSDHRRHDHHCWGQSVYCMLSCFGLMLKPFVQMLQYNYKPEQRIKDILGNMKQVQKHIILYQCMYARVFLSSW